MLGSGTTYDRAALCQAATNTCFATAARTGVCLLICPKHGRKVIRTDLSEILSEIADFLKTKTANFHSCTVHFDTIKVFYLPTDEIELL
jgi:hypothetical protein